uniref:G_PROTEIN_RECEP_F1_2 domain-containing protein n=1 Tax=Panagrellus redivivus TaxID=6233 RepID=A0A7E4WE02_PANRE
MPDITTETVLNLTDNAGGAELFEMCIEVITVFFCVLLMVMLFRSYPYHVHLWAFVVNLVMTIATYTILRFAIIVTSFYKVNPGDGFNFWVHIAQHSAMYSEAFAILAIVVERTLAAKFSKKYEKSRQFGVCAFIIALAWVLPAILTICSLYFEVLPYPALLATIIALCVTSTIVMVLLKIRVNKRRKERLTRWSKTADITNNELSRQYQAHSVFRKQLVLLLNTASNLVSSSDGEVPASRAARSGQVYAVSHVASMEMHFASLQDAWEHYDPHHLRQTRAPVTN